MSENESKITCDTSSNCCSPTKSKESFERGRIERRDFIKRMGLVMGGLLFGLPAMSMNNFHSSRNKNSPPNLFENLYERGQPEIYSGKELAYIGMPIGGLFTGTVYLGGDGKLWLWDIFNEYKEGIVSKTYENWQGKKQVKARDGANFIFPVSLEYPFEQGFGIKVKQQKEEWEKSLDFKGFENITFKGQYPIAEVSYRDSNLPVEIDLLSFSPFKPLDVKSSSYPATIMNFKVTNSSNEKVQVELSGWLENAALNNSQNNPSVQIFNNIQKTKNHSVLNCVAKTDSETIMNQTDFGNMSLLLLNSDKNTKATAEVTILKSTVFPENEITEATAAHGEQLCGAISKTFTLKPKETKEIVFVISWYFPNVILPKYIRSFKEFEKRHYVNQFKNAQDVALEIAKNYAELYENTILWNKVFYEESTLPHWFLNRSFLNTSILATETCLLLEDGRFWAWEGIGCCPGTCTHVWHYAQALGRIFPEIEKNLREKTDFVVINKETGGIHFRGALAKKYAADGQAGIVLRSYRDYQISTNNDFLKKNWENIKLTLQYLINLDNEDGQANGTIFGEQHNTLDAEWYGNIPVITSLYLASLAAAIEMAKVMNDIEAQKEYTTILELGKKNIEELFNGEYFIQIEDPKHKDAIGTGNGCYIDQVFGQSWAHQVGLGQLYNKEMINSSLESLWKYNFVKDMGTLRDSLAPEVNGRPYALSGDTGLVMCTWPLGGKKQDWEKHWQFGYFNECMTGFEHQVASHMIWEDKLDYGFTIMKAIHERYSPDKRNPYNEIECSDHYSRAMASYGAFIAVCGFTYNGPKGQIGFAPKLTPENFSAAFTAAESWGTMKQIRTEERQTNKLKIAFGNLSIQEISLELPENKIVKNIEIKVNNKTIQNKVRSEQNKLSVLFNRLELMKNDEISVYINS